MKVCGKIVDIYSRNIYSGIIHFNNGIIERIDRNENSQGPFIMPGLIDSHVHIESSMITPGSFAKAAVSRGTTAVVSDPHEIANVLGMEGIRFMIEDSKKVPLKFFFGAPSCVPATSFERNGATLDHNDIKKLLQLPEIKFLSEMMNFPGVIYKDPEVIKKLDVAKELGKPVDGHAPGLTGESLGKYISAGISTDHECSTIEEAREKISLGMKVLIREGSAARNLNALKDLYRTNPEMVMLCSDDLHPEMLAKRHINKLIAQLVSAGYDLFDVIRSCTVNPANHYNLNIGLLQAGQPADFILVDDYKKMNVKETWINGIKVYDRGSVLFAYNEANSMNKFNCSDVTEEDISVPLKGDYLRVIQAVDKELLTRELIVPAGNEKFVHANPGIDLLKIVVKDRYYDSPPSVGFIKGFGLKRGAFASSVAHDSHNIICIGAKDKDIVKAINELIKLKGGLAVSSDRKVTSLQLKIAGIMSDRSCEEVAFDYKALSRRVNSFGCKLSAPFMTLSFMALLVIPELKISDNGLFDGKNFCNVPLFVH